MLGVDLPTLLIYTFVLVIALPAHELAHAWAADALGDPTPRSQGRLSLNPLVHLDLMGSLLLLFAGFGWAKPVQINPGILRRRSPAALMLVSAAGPLTNAALALVAAIPFWFGFASEGIPPSESIPSPEEFLITFVLINLVLALFNLLPIAPLDGEEVLSFFLPPRARAALAAVSPYGPFVLLGLILLGRFGEFDPLGWLIFNPAKWLTLHLLGWA
jgi:Zn-dependent protease